MTNPKRPRSLLDGMADIAKDFWGTPLAAAEEVPAAREADTVQEFPANSQFSAIPEAPSAVPVAPSAPIYRAALPFSDLWKIADEPIDWTEALASPVPTDGMTSPEKWAKRHALADKVLSGDLSAYLEVLKAANPMADLTAYTASLDVATVDADTLDATFAVRPDLLSSDGEHYLAGLSLRIARDLMAVLPVTKVRVTAQADGAAKLIVLFDRSELTKVRFSFIDPVAFTRECGGVFQ